MVKDTCHLIVDARASQHLNDKGVVNAWVNSILAMTGMQELGRLFMQLPVAGYDSGPGIELLVSISTSHLCLHTWPEYGVLTFDFYSCQPYNGEQVFQSLYAQFGITELITDTEVRRWTPS